MIDAAMLLHLVLEQLARRVLPRVPEPELITHDPAQIAAFEAAGRENGILAFTYFFHALHIMPVVRPGDRVLDLGCGPANQLAQVARLNPDARFVGLDASANMLDRARATLARCAIGNVELLAGDMTRLTQIDDARFDCVTCTMSLHHLPDLPALARAMREARRVLKPGGGLYVVDFGRFKRTGTQRYFAQVHRDAQSAQFTQDYLDSLRAAFSVDELTSAAGLLGPGFVRHLTTLVPLMVVFKSADRRALDAASQRLARNLYGQLTKTQQRAFRGLARWFRGAGFALPCALD